MNQSISKDAASFLRKNFVAVLATSYLNLPYASIVYYMIDEKLNFYFVTKSNTDKHHNIKANKNVALAIGDGLKHISVQVRGHATVLKDEKRRDKVLEEIEAILKEKKIVTWPIKRIKELQAKKKDLDEEIVYKVTPLHLSFTNLDDESLPDSVSNERHSILPVLKK